MAKEDFERKCYICGEKVEDYGWSASEEEKESVGFVWKGDGTELGYVHTKCFEGKKPEQGGV